MATVGLALLVGCQPASVFVQVASDTFYGCGLTSRHHVECWSDFELQEAEEYNFGQADPPAGEFAQISAAFGQACGIEVSGALQCWGVQDGGQWDYGQTVSDPGPYTSVSTGFSHTCAISTGGELRCWGRADNSGFVAPSGAAIAVSIGALYECALRAGGEVECTGNNALAEPGPYTALSAGDDHVCALGAEDGLVSCWPYGYAPENYQGGYGGETLKLSSIASNASASSCGLDADGARHCWGWPQYENNPVGDGPSPEGPFTAVSMADTWAACMILLDGGIGCVYLRSDVIDAPSASWPSPLAPRYPSD